MRPESCVFEVEFLMAFGVANRPTATAVLLAHGHVFADPTDTPLNARSNAGSVRSCSFSYAHTYVECSQERSGGKRAAPWRTRVCCGWREAFVCDSKGNGDGDRHPPCAVKVLTQLGNFGSDGAKYTDTTGRDGNCLRTKAAAQHGTKYTGRI